MSVSSPIRPDFSGRVALISKIKSGAILALGFAVCASALISCSPAASTRNAKASDPAISSNLQPSIDPITPLPPGSGDRPLQAGQSGTQYTPDGLPALTPESTLSADQLFAEKLSNDSARFKRLENAVADLRRQFDAVKPAIIRLTAVEADMEQLVTQLQTLTPGGGPMPSAPVAHVNDPMPMPDIGPMPDTSTNDLLDEPKVPAKTVSEKKKPEAKKTASETAPHSPAVISTEDAVEPIAPIAAAPKEYVGGAIATVEPVAPVEPVTMPKAFQLQTFENASQKSEAAEKALKVEKNVAVAQAPKVAATPMAVEPVKPAMAPVAVPGTIQVRNVRIADHGNQTRIVIDATEKTPFTYNLDNSENLLMIELPNVAWAGAQSGSTPSPLAGSWTVSDDGKTVVLAVSLKNKAAVVSSTTLPASGTTPYRIVFDLKPSS